MTVSLKRAWDGDCDLSVDAQLNLALWLLSIEQSLAWHMGVCLDALALKHKDGQWTLRIQGRRQGRGKGSSYVVTWTHAPTLYHSLWLFAQNVKHNEVQWRTDKYPVFDK